MDDFEKELKEEFLNESLDLLENAESAFLELESNTQDLSVLEEIFRLAHNLKGTSRAVGFGQIAELTHKAENLILKLKDREIEVSEPVVSVLLEFNDLITQSIKELRDDHEAQIETKEIECKIENVLNGNYEVSSTEEIPDAGEFNENFEEDESAKRMSDIADDTESALDQAQLLEEPEGAERITPIKDKAVDLKEKKKDKSSKAEESIRVSLSKIDLLNNFVGELVILQTVLDQRKEQYISDELSAKSISQLGKLSKEIQEIAMSFRMVPLKSTFQKMSRIIRDTSKTLEKDVNLILTGEETEIDKSVLEQLSDPLVHIVRNAVDHGLEENAQREELGKPRLGNVHIKAYHEGSNMVIEVQDDGKGIDADVIRNKIVEKGIMNDASHLNDHDAIQFVFHPGFSTKEQLTEVSGRGVGLDVVKTNIEAMSGEVKLMSSVSQGSTFKIILPLTLAIIDALVVKCGDERFIIPMVQVHEFVRIDSENYDQISGLGECLKIRGEVIPMFTLGEQLSSLNEVKKDNKEDISMIIRNSDQMYSVRVNEVLNQQQVVIKSLGDEIRNKKGFMGCSILGDGKPAFIVDLNELYGSEIEIQKNKNSNNLVA